MQSEDKSDTPGRTVIDYDGDLKAGQTYRAAVRGDKVYELVFVPALKPRMHQSVSVDWTNLDEFPALRQLSLDAGERVIVFSVLSDKTTYMGGRRWDRVLLCKVVAVDAGQSAAPEGWRQIGTDKTISFLLPDDMKQTDAVGDETPIAEYANGRMRIMFEFRPWGLTAPRRGRRRARHVKGYREEEVRIDGKWAYLKTYSPSEKEKGQAYTAELMVVTKAWAPYVELLVTFTGNDASDLRVAERVFASIQFPAERAAPR
ncbi:MAG: hypothetical protein JOZ96_01690 [Acidobacteria bacterium]|nr:hypothetical protein [Acidobacteriota bacterium]